MKYFKIILVIAFTTILGMAATSHAAFIVPTSVQASNTFGSYEENDLINGDGLTGATHSTQWWTMWMGSSTPPLTLTFDLGTIYDLASASVWNYNYTANNTKRGVKDFNILGSLDGTSYTSITTATLSEASGLNTQEAEIVSFSTSARYIQFELTSNYGHESYTGLSEVRFSEAVPEPSLGLLLGISLVGLVGVGAVRKIKTE